MREVNLTACDQAGAITGGRRLGIQYPTLVKPVWQPMARQSVSVLRKPLSAAATVCRRTASRSPSNWNNWA